MSAGKASSTTAAMLLLVALSGCPDRTTGGDASGDAGLADVMLRTDRLPLDARTTDTTTTPDTFSPDTFSPDTFSPDTFSPDTFSLDAAHGDAPEDAGEVTECVLADFGNTTECVDNSSVTLPAPGDYGSAGSYTVERISLVQHQVTAYLPEELSDPAPVIFFAHAYMARSEALYEHTLETLATLGFAVIHAPYTGGTLGDLTDLLDRYDQLWDAFLFASTAVRLNGRLDLTRVGFVGHSFGGGAVPELARRGFEEQGWGASGRFIFSMAPWFSWGSGYDTLPLDTRVVVQVYSDDITCSHCVSADFWDRLPAGIEKVWQVVHPDACECALVTEHGVPFTSTNEGLVGGREDNGHDVWAVRRRIHALAQYAFTGDVDARAVAYGEETSMGSWIGCGGRAVTPIETSTAPTPSYCEARSQFRCECRDPLAAGEECPVP